MKNHYQNILIFFSSNLEMDLFLTIWGRILEEVIEDIKSTSIFVGCTVALGSDVPEDIALNTSSY